LRLALPARVTLILAIAFHHRFHGPPFDYSALAAAAAASWVGVPGPGEPVLIAAGVLAARHKLDIGEVILVAWIAATLGGVAGWVIGIKAGRTVLTTRGPLRRLRLKALARGDDIFRRYTVLAVLLTPSWIAGIHGVRTRTFLPVNAASAALWAAGIGLGAYFAGPSVVEFVDDLGWVTAAGLVILIAVAVGAEMLRRRRKARRGLGRPPRGEVPPPTPTEAPPSSS
jgi:membrane protein DedA with SNARE-associated domain